PEVTLGADGRYGYAALPRYWAEPERRYAFLVRVDSQVAGFVLVHRGSPAVDDPDVLDVAEFFVMRRYRRAGVGQRVASLLWRQLPGRWTVRVSERNTGALDFWHAVIEDVVGDRATLSTRPHRGAAWRVYDFEIPAISAFT
ncbi:MAG: GNAT family N-acetyltransferase, partial [Gemmatimonadaceae bacterium]